ncbi:MAG: hypothetical protein ACHQF0_00960 [Chitinophagales bacterium]
MKTRTMKGRFASTNNLLVIIASVIIISSCSKDSGGSNSSQSSLSYGDSILYLKTQATDYIVYPTEQRPGQYLGFPEGIEIDQTTGAINVSKSETGLRYRITYISPQGDTTITKVVISGINFLDKFHHLSQGDSIAFPVYNASIDRILPVNGSNFDEGNNANSGGCDVKTVNGQINLAQTVRNGVFGSTPQNNANQQFDIYYRLNDGSNKALDKITVKVYYYNTINDVAPDLLQTLQDRENDGVFLGTTPIHIPNNPSTARTESIHKAAKPRPPCVIIIAN